MLSAPVVVEILLTYRCDLRCRHCYLKQKLGPIEMPWFLLKKLIKEMHDLDVFEVILSGGEPFLYSNLKRALFILEDLDLSCRILTNGQHIDKKWATILNKFDNVKVQVSVDGAEPKSHELLRGKGTFENAISAIHKMVDEGIQVNMGTVIHKYNVKQIPDIINLADNINVKGINFIQLMPIGNLDAYDLFKVSSEQKERLYSFLNSIRRRYKNLRVSFEADLDPIQYLKLKAQMTKLKCAVDEGFGGLCDAAIAKCSVDPYGYVYPCDLFVVLDEFRSGNILKRSFIEIWNKSENLNLMRRLEPRSIDGCYGCEHIELCRGGCRALAYAHTGNFLARDPRCSTLILRSDHI